MSNFDLEAAKVRARKVFRRRKWRRVFELVIPVTTHLGSVVTIAVAWFARTGSFKFDAAALSDWGAGLLALTVSLGGFYLIRKSLPAPSEMIVTRDELSVLLAVARSNATQSIHIVAGDLSWLADDLQSIIAIKSERPALHIYIHYDRHRVSRKEVKDIQELDRNGVRLLPHNDQSLTTRFTIIDIMDSSTHRAYTYEHARIPGVTEPRSKNQFTWKEFGPDSLVVIRAFCAIIELLRRAPVEPLRIGISGVNNVGKTSLANELRLVLSADFKVHLVPDQFRLVNDGASFDGSVAILLAELIGSEIPNDTEIVIYDRTLLDNLLFLRVRSDQDDLYREIVKPIVSVIKTYDLIIYVKRSMENFSARTSHVLARDRHRVQDMFVECFSIYDIPHREISMRLESFDTDVREAAATLSKEVRDIYQRRRIAPP
jgi:hypothetical protein